ncbi:MAG: radical SAM family heme chaperone HemW [Ignavibacteriae bacterium]|nr:radical SAM family heme chaperone HemW [Ignavibacteriota bacterium]
MASLYLHIPFCEHKCIYCDFYSVESLDSMDRFLSALKQEIELYADYSIKEEFETIFFGGGTPSLLKPKTLHEILDRLSTTFTIRRDAEVTVEANPGTVDRAKLRSYREAGVNRLSFGVQSFHDDELKFLTRIHSSEQAKVSVLMAKDVGFNNVNIDLIFSLPNQTLQRWEENLRQAVELEPQHISAYSLIVEKGTPLADMVAAKLVSPLPVETEAEMYEFTMAYLRSAGFQHYEVSNYAKPGFRSRHNSNYWNHSNYLGFGPSAHSFWSATPLGDRRRWWNVRSIDGYCEKILNRQLPLAGQEVLTEEQLVEEAIMLGLRSDGIDLYRLSSEFGVDLLTAARSTIEQLTAEHLTTLNDHTLRLTDKGYLLCDEISEVMISSISLAHTSCESV